MRLTIKKSSIFWCIILFLSVYLLFLAPNLVNAEERSIEGTAYAVLEDDGDLILFRSNDTYADGAGQTVTDIMGSTYTGQVYTGIETTNVYGTGNSKWYSQRSAVKTVKVADGQKIMPTNCCYWFYNCSNMTSVDLKGLDTGDVTSMSNMFSGCSNLTTLDVSGWNTGNVMNMNSMFYGCSKLTILDVSGWDTENVANMNSMFYQCYNLPTLDVSGWDTRNVMGMYDMFYNCSKLTALDVSGWNTGNVMSMYDMFYCCSNMTALDVSGWDTRNVMSMYDMFYNCSKLTALDVSGWNTGNVTSMSEMFSGCSNLTTLDVSGWNTGNVMNMGYMFNSCSKLTTLDVSGWDTRNVTNMSYMFYSCSRLTTLDVSGWKTGTVTNMGVMFGTCITLTTLDMSGWNTGNVTNMYGMFSGCSKLTSITLGEDFSFKGKNISATSNQAILPTPPSSTTTEKWIKEDKSVEAKTPTELRNDYDANASTWAGKWVWDVKSTSVIIIFDPNGGYMNNTLIIQQTPAMITLPTKSDVTRFSYYLTGWNTEQNGSGMSYAEGASYTPEAGKTTTLYAQWDKEWKYTVNHYKQNDSLNGYFLNKTEVQYAIPSSTVTPDTDTYTGFRNPVPQTVVISADASITVDYYYDRMVYDIHFDGNGADSGAMPDQHVFCDVTDRLLDNRFVKENSWFSGWNTEANGSGTHYNDAQTINNIASDGQTKTLYASWVDLADTSMTPTNGSYVIRLKAGQEAILPDLPAGTQYDIQEINNPVSWTQQSAANNTGVINPNTESNASVSNIYSAKGSVQLYAYKVMENGDLQEGEYVFELLQGDTVIGTARNGTPDPQEEILSNDGETVVKNPYYGMSKIVFDDIEFTGDGSSTYNYTIRERNTGDDSIEYDSHTEPVIVNVSDNHNGTLTCVAEYDADGPVFTNRKKPVVRDVSKTGNLSVEKIVNNINTNDSFIFTITLKDHDDIELNDRYSYDIVESDSNEYINSGEITSGDTVQLHGGQKIIISGIPEGVYYAVEEQEKSGYDLVSSDGESGIIAENITAEAIFTNAYTAEGNAVITAEKTFENGTMEDNQFMFQLTDSTGAVLQTAFNNAAGLIAFEPIFYSNEDIGKRYSYYIIEQEGTDDDIFYDSKSIEVIVQVNDNRDGTISTDVSYPNGRTFTNKAVQRRSLQVKKTVSGNFGNRAKDFAFTISLSNDEINKKPVSISYTKNGVSGTLDLINGSGSFTLSHGDTITFAGIPSGTSYTVSENGDTDYTTTWKAGALKTPDNNLTVTGDTKICSGIIEEDSKIVFDNQLEAVVPTGVLPFNDGIAVVIMIAGAICFILVYAKNKNRKANL